MSMVCSLQAFKDADLDLIRSGEQIEDYFKQSESSFPLGLYVIEVIGVLYIAGHTCYMFHRFWYIWLFLTFGLLGYLYIENKGLGKKQNKTTGIRAEKELWLDKAWHGIHFLLTGSAWEGDEPLNFLVASGEPIEGTESEYGEDRLFTSQQVKQIDAVLQGITKEQFQSRFDPNKMMAENIYPTIWDRPKEEDDTLGYIMEYFVKLKQFIHNIAEKNMGMIVGLS